MKTVSRIITILSIFLLLSCSESSDISASPNEIRVGVLPDQEISQLQARYTPLLRYIEKETATKTRLIIPDSYADLLRMFHEKEVDLAYFGGATFVKASIRDKAQPLVMRDVDAKFTSYFIVSTKDKTTKIDDYKGKSLSFGSKLSTSGHFMPRFYMSEKSIIPENYFSAVTFSGAHDKTAELVRDEQVDIGVLNSVIFNKMSVQGRLKQDQVRILWETPPYPDYVWAVQHNVPEDQKERIRWAFLDLRKSDASQKEVLEALGSEGFLPADMSDFLPLQKVMAQLEK